VKGREVRYEALQVPARVEGRDFIFRRVKDPTTGRWVSKLEFRPGEERMVQFRGLENLLPPKGERPVFDLRRIGRAIRQLRQASPELFVRADVRQVVVLDAESAKRRDYRGEADLFLGFIFLNPQRIAQGNPFIGVTDPNTQFLLTLTEELLHFKVREFALKQTDKWVDMRESIREGEIYPPLYRQGEHPQRQWRRDFDEWVSKGLAAYLTGERNLLRDEVVPRLRELWQGMREGR
jgi:hypothetical protein